MRWVLTITVAACLVGCKKREEDGSEWSGGPVPVPVPGGTARASAGHIDVTVIPVTDRYYTIWVSTRDDTKSTPFTAWSDSVETVPPLRDDLGNAYTASIVSLRPGDLELRADSAHWLRGENISGVFQDLRKRLPATIEDRSGRVTSRTARADLLQYEPIIPKATRLIMTLPASNVGGQGMLRFEFDREQIKLILVAPKK